MADDLIGMIRMFAGHFAPNGYLPCDGTSLQIRGYEPLFSVIGTTYGGDGMSSFTLPDLRPTDPASGQKAWNPDQPRMVICVQGNFPNRS
jgi:microcystin-dependent protein